VTTLIPFPDRLTPVDAESGVGDLDPSDLGQVFRRFAPYVARIAGRVLGRWDEVDDVVQDVFLDASRGLRSLRDPFAIKQWLATVTVRKVRRRLRRRGLMRFLGLDDAAAVPDPGASPETRAHAVAVYRVLDELSADRRTAWVMHRVEDQSLEQVAEVCGCSRATAHRWIREAQQVLEKGLRDAQKR
jgi:RNA polymerase sigma-70 factor (ECF subfamily)